MFSDIGLVGSHDEVGEPPWELLTDLGKLCLADRHIIITLNGQATDLFPILSLYFCEQIFDAVKLSPSLRCRRSLTWQEYAGMKRGSKCTLMAACTSRDRWDE